MDQVSIPIVEITFMLSICLHGDHLNSKHGLITRAIKQLCQLVAKRENYIIFGVCVVSKCSHVNAKLFTSIIVM